MQGVRKPLFDGEKEKTNVRRSCQKRKSISYEIMS